MESTVVDISIPPPFFKPVALSLSRISSILKHPNKSVLTQSIFLFYHYTFFVERQFFIFIYIGQVVSVRSYGVFLDIGCLKNGMVHVSELKNGADGGMLTKIDDELNVGDVLQVKVSGVTTKGDIYLTQRDDTDLNSIIDPKDVQEQQDNDEKEEEVSIESDAVPHNAVCNRV